MSQHEAKSTQPQTHDELVPPSDLYAIYQALLSPQGNYVQRMRAVQAAAALYDPEKPESGVALEQEFSNLIHKSVSLSPVQLRCFKEIFVNEPAFAHIAPWVHPANVW